MKNYNLKFGLQYKNNTWHVVSQENEDALMADCNKTILMGRLLYSDSNYYIYPIEKVISITYSVNTQLSYNRLCSKCKKKFNLTQEDINHYIVLAKLKVKI